MVSCKPMMRKLAVFSNTPLYKWYFVLGLLENDIVGLSKRLIFFFSPFFLYSYYLLIYFPFWGKKWEYFNEQLMARILVLTNHFYLLSDFCSSTWLCQENWQLNLYIFIFRLFWFWFNSKSTKSCLGIDRCNIEVCGVETWAFILKELSNLYFLVKKFVSRSGIDCWSGEMKSSFSWQWITIWKTDLF